MRSRKKRKKNKKSSKNLTQVKNKKKYKAKANKAYHWKEMVLSLNKKKLKQILQRKSKLLPRFRRLQNLRSLLFPQLNNDLKPYSKSDLK